MITPGRFADFADRFGALLARTPGEDAILRDGGALLAELIAQDDWLPERFSRPRPDRYTQYLLHLDPAKRFSVVSFVWGPGQGTPIHDHTVWGLVGVLRGAEFAQRYGWDGDALVAQGERERLEAGHVDAVSPTVGDIHQVANAFADQVSISIHVYGGDIGTIARHSFSADGQANLFVSGYAMPIESVSPLSVRSDLLEKREIALLDLREEADYALDHPLFAANLPLGRLELEILDRVPRKDTRIVLYDAGEGLVAAAHDRLTRLGYRVVQALAGGLEGWRAAGLELFQDVNSASKAFGELVEARRHTPSLSAQTVLQEIERGADMVVLDARRFEEYNTMSIPTGISVPGAELVLRARALAPDPATRIPGQLRRAHAQHHRGPVADQCRHSQSRGCAAQRHHRLAAGRADAG